MQRASFITGLLAAAALCTLNPVLAQDRGTKDEAKALVEAAVAHVKKVGPEKAFKDFSTDKASWVKKDLYVFAFDMEGNTLAHGANEKLIGKNLSKMLDASGKSTTEAFANTVKTKGSGWHDYDFAHPTTKKTEAKTSYVQGLPGGKSYVGVGVYR